MVYPGARRSTRGDPARPSGDRCTSLYGVPTMFIAELALPTSTRFDLSSLRTGIMAGSPCPVEVMKQVIDRMGMAEVTICYGMTETSPVSTQTAPTTTSTTAPGRSGGSIRTCESRSSTRRPG
jgi:fatty-acyl-CoA synthase